MSGLDSGNTDAIVVIHMCHIISGGRKCLVYSSLVSSVMQALRESSLQERQETLPTARRWAYIAMMVLVLVLVHIRPGEQERNRGKAWSTVDQLQGKSNTYNFKKEHKREIE